MDQNLEINNCSSKCGQPQAVLNIYSPETLVGNWFEQSVKDSCKRNEFIQKRDSNQLSFQKSQIMVDLLLKPVKLTFTPDNQLNYGDTVQIMSPGPGPEALKDCPFKNYCHLIDLTLSSSLPPSVIDQRQHLDFDSVITASQCIYPCVRNSFILEHPDGPSEVDGKKVPILYGDVFRIKALSTQHKCDLYLSCTPTMKFYSASKFSGNPIVQFGCKNTSTLWRCFPLTLTAADAKLIVQTETPVLKNQRLLIQHGLSGKSLCVEKDFQIINHFGNEQEVTVETKFDVLKRVDWSNHWYFDTDRSEDREEEKKRFEKIAQEAAEAKAKEIEEKAAAEAEAKAKEIEEKAAAEAEAKNAEESKDGCVKETKEKDGQDPKSKNAKGGCAKETKGEDAKETKEKDGQDPKSKNAEESKGEEPKEAKTEDAEEVQCKDTKEPPASSSVPETISKPTVHQYQFPNRNRTLGPPCTGESKPVLKKITSCVPPTPNCQKSIDYQKHDAIFLADCKSIKN